MSFYEAQSWQVPVRQIPWEQSIPPSRSGVWSWTNEKSSMSDQSIEATSATQRDDMTAFAAQVEEVDRALDNLNKSGKLFSTSSRRDSMPVIGVPRPYSDFDHRSGAMTQRHHSIGDYDQMRSHAGSNLQSYYANQRHQPRPNEAEQMVQAKRRMAAQRERELRNYHQEQQYNRNISTQGKSDRAISPNAMNEEDRRELIARQHRALYGNDGGSFYESGNFGDDAHTPRPSTQPSGNSTSAGGAQGSSPNTFGVNQNQAPSSLTETTGHISADQTQPNAPKGSSPIPQQPRSRANSTSSPASNPQNFSLFESTNQQSSRTSTSSPGGSPPRQTKSATAPIGSGVGPIGTRPTGQGINPALSKRSTTPLPSPLSYGFAPNESLNANSGNERSTSAASNTSATVKDANMGSMAWGNSGGVWGKNSLSVQASVWG